MSDEDVLNGTGDHHEHAQRQDGRIVTCSCELRVEGRGTRLGAWRWLALAGDGETILHIGVDEAEARAAAARRAGATAVHRPPPRVR